MIPRPFTSKAMTSTGKKRGKSALKTRHSSVGKHKKAKILKKTMTACFLNEQTKKGSVRNTKKKLINSNSGSD